MKKSESFEENLAELEELVRKLENDDLPLDESITTFEKAVKLVKAANEKLEKAEQKVRILTVNTDGTVTDRPFDKEDET